MALAAHLRTTLAVAALLTPTLGFATNGYFSHGYGIKSKGMAGVGIALPVDAMAAATNPAGIVFVGNSLQIGLDWFKPDRSASIAGNGGVPAFGVPSLDGNYDGNGSSSFLIPDFGYNRLLRPDLALGLVLYGNGGMNTTYDRSPFTSMGGPSPAGVNLTQLFIAPTVAYKLNPRHSIGLSVNLAYQQFSADGLQPFGGFGLSSDQTKLTNNGVDSSSGWGVRVGWTGKISDMITLGATYQSKTKMGKFDKYAGLFADGGKFDIPANYGVGVAAKLTPQLTVAADVQKIEYSGIPAIANSIGALSAGRLLGQAGGPGFGWRDMTVFKLGVSFEMNSKLTLRAGYSHGRQPIPAGETFFNILAPGVIEDHLTLGATWKLSNGHELSVAYMHGFEKSVNGSNSIPPSFGGGEANLRMSQNAIGIAYSIGM
ncbi:MAG: outer membrane protein transport protein [Burkholderiaceae bacterium]|nr:outer membrane protein transport protein [Burkholderiaceae bacterium]